MKDCGGGLLRRLTAAFGVRRRFRGQTDEVPVQQV
jgi:hypothetical protein